MREGELISSITMAVCSILFSLGGFLVGLFMVLQKSKCKTIQCCCGFLKCNRTVEIELVSV
tara:strand:- start:16 stop:198 length:183 start_codon:yes stop_codon:yes gene_type:complete